MQMHDSYFRLLEIYREKISIPWSLLERLSNDVENVGYFDDKHGIKLVDANEYLKKYGFIEQVSGVAEHVITDKGKNYYGVEKLLRQEAAEKETLTIDKLKKDIKKLENELGDYRTIKTRANVAFIISLITVSLAAITLILKAVGRINN